MILILTILPGVLELGHSGKAIAAETYFLRGIQEA
jgi:hypothetical protein